MRLIFYESYTVHGRLYYTTKLQELNLEACLAGLKINTKKTKDVRIQRSEAEATVEDNVEAETVESPLIFLVQ